MQGLPIHLDGARVFNAAVALGVDVRAITDLVTSVQFCLSKVRLSLEVELHATMGICRPRMCLSVACRRSMRSECSNR